MTLFRIIAVLVGGLLLLLVVVVQRAETTRLHYQIARVERAADDVRQQLRDAELELARLRNPTRIRQRVEQALTNLEEAPAPRRANRGAGDGQDAGGQDARGPGDTP
ncbi:MAG: hypothetical protein AB1716_17950 [Planctomycetota bacterium]